MTNQTGKKNRTRVDVALVDRGLVPSRQRAQSLIMAGEVLVNDVPCTKAGIMIDSDTEIRIRDGALFPYVSRGALKLKQALETWSIPVMGKVALDVGASTGGFTEILLENGAERVFAVDVGHQQMAWKIRSDRRVVCLEKTHARYMSEDVIGQKVDIIVMDVSFISATKILPNLLKFSHDHSDWILLVKPQFELSPSDVSDGGIVTSEEARQRALKGVVAAAAKLGLKAVSTMPSPIRGTDGNEEFLAHFRKTPNED